MHRSHDLSSLDWTLTGWAPFLWRAAVTMEIGAMATPDHRVASVPVPGSVQIALRDAGLLPDWTQAGKPLECEWVENRSWMYEATLPDEWLDGSSIRLTCLGLDYSGWVLLNGVEVGTFVGTNVPHIFNLTGHLAESGNVLKIVFDVPPRWMGQFGYTSKFTEWKTRFNYTWDWQPRLVQLGIWDDISLDVVDGIELVDVHCISDADPTAATGILNVSGEVAGEGARVTVSLRDGDRVLRSETLEPSAFAAGIRWDDLAVDLWWPNGQGAQPLYGVDVVVTDAAGVVQDRRDLRVGFRNVAWERCEGTPETSDTWICVVNGRKIFLQGVNFPPMAPNFADVTEQQYRERLELYKEIGLNTFRINACQYLEKKVFYDICDELGLLVWQDLPITSSLIENIPPADAASIDALDEIFRSFIARSSRATTTRTATRRWCRPTRPTRCTRGSPPSRPRPTRAVGSSRRVRPVPGSTTTSGMPASSSTRTCTAPTVRAPTGSTPGALTGRSRTRSSARSSARPAPLRSTSSASTPADSIRCRSTNTTRCGAVRSRGGWSVPCSSPRRVTSPRRSRSTSSGVRPARPSRSRSR